jgi:hypothetical protein
MLIVNARTKHAFAQPYQPAFIMGTIGSDCKFYRDGGLTLATYLVTYHGGSEMPNTPEARQQMEAAFGSWAAGVGPAMIDPGAPLTAAKTVSAGHVQDGQTVAVVSGYTLLRADNLDAAVKLVQSHPFLTRGGSLQVIEAADLGGQAG